MRFLRVPAVVLLLWTSAAWATMTDAQYDVLKNDIMITNSAEFGPLIAVGNDQGIADAYNLQANPTFWVWQTSLTDKTIYETKTSENTVWDWNVYGQQPDAQRDEWKTMFRPGAVNPSLQQTRDGWAAIFKGGGAAGVQLTHLLTVGRRLALRVEALLVVPGSGNGTTATPGVMGYEGKITSADVSRALRGTP